VAVQTLILETDSPCLSKGWPLFRRPALPITYCMRFGRSFAAPEDVREFVRKLDKYFHAELAAARQNDWLEARRP